MVVPHLVKRGEEHPRWQGGRRIDGDGYVRVWCPDHPNAYDKCMLEHRLVMERHLGRMLTTDEQVHHLNGDRQDNRVENLTILTRAEHAREHGLGRTPRAWTDASKAKLSASKRGVKWSAGRSADKQRANLERARRKRWDAQRVYE